MNPEYFNIEVGGKTLTVFYPQFETNEGFKVVSEENHLPVVLKNHEDYLTVLDYIATQDEYTVEKLGELADLIEQMSLLAKGPKGDTRFMWVKYADDDSGSGMSDNPEGKKYIGLAYNKDTETPSNEASDYKWVKYVADLDGLVYENRNLISHNKDNWEQGYWESGDNGVKRDLSTAIRLGERIELDSNEEYVLTSYGSYRVVARLYDANDVHIRRNDALANDSITLNMNNVKYARIHVSSDSDITPDMIGDEIKIKLEKGDTSTEWSPPYKDIYEYLDAHKADKTNPHSVTKSQVGLGNVPNYTAATQSQAENGTTNAALMTPLRTKQAIEKLLEDIGVVYVVESYEENDTFVTKYSDGKMEMTQFRNMGSVGANGNGTMENPYRSPAYSWVFPEPFIVEPVILVTPNAYDLNGASRLLTAYYRENSIYNATYIQVASVSDKYPSNDAYVNLLAVGRWK